MWKYLIVSKKIEKIVWNTLNKQVKLNRTGYILNLFQWNLARIIAFHTLFVLRFKVLKSSDKENVYNEIPWHEVLNNISEQKKQWNLGKHLCLFDFSGI